MSPLIIGRWFSGSVAVITRISLQWMNLGMGSSESRGYFNRFCGFFTRSGIGFRSASHPPYMSRWYRGGKVTRDSVYPPYTFSFYQNRQSFFDELYAADRCRYHGPMMAVGLFNLSVAAINSAFCLMDQHHSLKIYLGLSDCQAESVRHYPNPIKPWKKIPRINLQSYGYWSAQPWVFWYFKKQSFLCPTAQDFLK